MDLPPLAASFGAQRSCAEKRSTVGLERSGKNNSKSPPAAELWWGTFWDGEGRIPDRSLEADLEHEVFAFVADAASWLILNKDCAFQSYASIL
eukprot:s207_g19.t1